MHLNAFFYIAGKVPINDRIRAAGFKIGDDFRDHAALHDWRFQDGNRRPSCSMMTSTPYLTFSSTLCKSRASSNAHGHVTTMILKRDAMKLDKTFDCVAMKEEIQQRLLREVAELGEGEAERRAERSAYRAIPFWVHFCGQGWLVAKHRTRVLKSSRSL